MQQRFVCGKELFSQCQFSTHSPTMFVQLLCAIVCVNICVQVENPKHLHPYHCLDVKRYSTN